MGREVRICYFLELRFELSSMEGEERRMMIAELWGRFSVHTPRPGARLVAQNLAVYLVFNFTSLHPHHGHIYSHP
jgi:hypothetical protein